MAKRLRDLSITTKLGLGFGTVCLLLVAAVGLGLQTLHTSQATVSSMSDVVVPGVKYSGLVKYGVAQTRLDVTSMGLATDAAGRASARSAMAADDAELDASWKGYLDTFPVSTQADRDSFQADLASFRQLRGPAVTAAENGDLPGFQTVRNRDLLPLATRMNTTLDRIQKAEVDNATHTSALGAARYREALWLLLGLGAVALVAAAVVAVLVARSITRPLGRTAEVVRGLAQGRLDQRVGYAAADEIGRLSQAVDETMDTLATTMTEITATAQVLAGSSEELSAVATQLSAGAEESAAQAQVVSAAAEEISANIGTVAAAGEQMTAAIGEIATSTADASATAASAVSAAEGAGQTLQRLSASSREIGEVVKLITSIAAQTNLLALNATIEAARAGDAGKGFAVVAGEVKELAGQTARATESITARVGATQADVEEASAAIARIGNVITQIDALQSTIAAAVEEQSATTGEMVRNVSEVSTGSQEIAVTISGVASAATQTTSGAHQTATTAADVSRAAARLQQLTAAFTL
ncbi:methyl-accepting chemotaxis protein [Kineococcus endophyticus]|uniref:Methyl-accepting chemotaxis protein n=1 Tax=Kineococcus endophyticus TaxID=1181883 RepID=A0ABV3P471_9ACTN